jgi:hypothetical protein
MEPLQDLELAPDIIIRNKIFMKIKILILLLLFCINTCQSGTMHPNYYILPLDYIDDIDIDKSTIILNSNGTQNIKLIDFQTYDYFTIENSNFRLKILHYTSIISSFEPLVYIIDDPHLNNGIIFLNIDHLHTRDSYREELARLKSIITDKPCRINSCQSRTILQNNTYVLPLDYIEDIDIDKSTITLNTNGIRNINLVNFRTYSYFTIENCNFKLMILPSISSLRLPEPVVYIIGSPLFNDGIIRLDINHLYTKDMYKKELMRLKTFITY